MDIAIQLICALIGGLFTLYSAWYANHLQSSSKSNSLPQRLMNGNTSENQSNILTQQGKSLILKDTGFMLLVVNICSVIAAFFLEFQFKDSFTIHDPTIDIKLMSALGFMNLFIITIILTIICIKTRFNKMIHLLKIVNLYFLVMLVINTISSFYYGDFTLMALTIPGYFIVLLLIPISFLLSYLFSWAK